jgi:hypothetical protein
MYEMHAECDPAIPGSVLVWHAVAKGRAHAMCGRILGDAGRANFSARAEDTAQYCPSCMGAVREAMAAVADR